MFRTQIYLTENEKASLDALVKATGKSQSELIRNAIDDFIVEQSSGSLKNSLCEAYGMWSDNDFDATSERTEFERDFT